MNVDFIQQLLARMQQNAQANVPVIPNNGNPMGANNMPSMTDNTGEDATGGHYPWMRPSPSMAYLHHLIGSMGTGGNGQVQTQQPMNTGGVYPATQVPGNTGIVPPSMQTNPAVPVLPGAPPIMSTNLPARLQVPTAGNFQGGGVVMPQYGPGRVYTR